MHGPTGIVWANLTPFSLWLGWAIDPFWPMNKQLWSPAYLFFMAGSCGYLLIVFYVIYDLDTTAGGAGAGGAAPPVWQRACRVFFTPCRQGC
jgi:predicted acyltransferase